MDGQTGRRMRSNVPTLSRKRGTKMIEFMPAIHLNTYTFPQNLLSLMYDHLPAPCEAWSNKVSISQSRSSNPLYVTSHWIIGLSPCRPIIIVICYMSQSRSSNPLYVTSHWIIGLSPCRPIMIVTCYKFHKNILNRVVNKKSLLWLYLYCHNLFIREIKITKVAHNKLNKKQLMKIKFWHVCLKRAVSLRVSAYIYVSNMPFRNYDLSVPVCI